MQSLSLQVSNHSRFNSPLLFGLLDCPDESSRKVILDAGELNSHSLEYYNKCYCRLYVSRLIYSIVHDARDDEIDLDAWANNLSDQIDECGIDLSELDIVLLWDLPNYINLLQFRVLCKLLVKYSSKSLKIHAYLYNTRFMPGAPQIWALHDEGKVSLQTESNDTVQCPGYNQTELQKHASPYIVEHVVMLSSGIEEYLFKLSC